MPRRSLYLLAAAGLGLLGYFAYSHQGSQGSSSPPQDVLSTSVASRNASSTISRLSVDGAAAETDMNDFRRDEVGFDLALDQIRPLPAARAQSRHLEEIREALKKNGLRSTLALDKKVSSLLRDDKIPRSDKITELLLLVDDFGVDSESGHYLLDVLGSLRPIEVADLLIDKFNNAKLSDSTKKKLMGILADTYGIDPANLAPEAAKLVAEQSIGIQDFFTQQIQRPTSGDIYRQAISLYPSVASPTEIDLLNESLMNHQDLIPVQEGISIRLDSSIGSTETQKTFLPELLEDVESGAFGNEIKQPFNDRLYTILQSESPGAENTISDSVRPQLESYLVKQEPGLDAAGVDFNSIYAYSTWLQAYAAAASSGNKPEFISNYLTSAASAIQQAAVTVAAGPELLSRLRQNPALQDNMTRALTDDSVASEARTVIQDAVQRLREPAAAR